MTKSLGSRVRRNDMAMGPGVRRDDGHELCYRL
jgi:hypothetical protein